MSKEKNGSDKFKRLKELAESPSNNIAQQNKSNIDRQNSTRRHFRPGHLEERKRRVLSEEEEAEKLKSSRQKDIQLLAQRSAVKNNPLLKKFEEQSQQPAKSTTSIIKDKHKLLNAADQIKRSSRVINSLKENSYVSSSIFRQQATKVPSTMKLVVSQKDLTPNNSNELLSEGTNAPLVEMSNQKNDTTPIITKEDDIDEHKLIGEIHLEEALPPTLPPKNKSRPSSRRITKKEIVTELMQSLETINEDHTTSEPPLETPYILANDFSANDKDNQSIKKATLSTFEETIVFKEPIAESEEIFDDELHKHSAPVVENPSLKDTKKPKIDKNSTNNAVRDIALNNKPNTTHYLPSKDVDNKPYMKEGLVSETKQFSSQDNKQITESNLEIKTTSTPKEDYATLDQKIVDNTNLSVGSTMNPKEAGSLDDILTNQDAKKKTVIGDDSLIQYSEASNIMEQPRIEAATTGANDNKSSIHQNTLYISPESLINNDLNISTFKDYKDPTYISHKKAVYEQDQLLDNSSSQLLLENQNLNTIENSNDYIQQHNQKLNTQRSIPLFIQTTFTEDDSEEEEGSATPTLANPHTLDQIKDTPSVDEDNRDSFVSASQSEEWYDPDDWQTNRQSHRQSDSSAMSFNSSAYSLKKTNSTEITRTDDDDELFKDEDAQEYHEIEINIKQEESEEEGEGEIVVYMDSSISVNESDASQKYLNVSNAYQKEDNGDDTYSLIRVPSQTNTICMIGQDQELEETPHDPKNPRIEDISHYLKELPPPSSKSQEVEENEDTSGVKRVKSVTKNNTSNQTPHDSAIAENQIFKGIPKAHEINQAFSTSFDLPFFGDEKRSSCITSSKHGKMYISLSGAHHVLLPVPKEPTYVRCIISNGEYEYMSGYELLSHQITLDYECVIDTKPGMIVTVSLHVRQDQHVKPKSGWSKWFTSIRKQKEHLSGYVYPDDGAIGQTKFAVDHMVPGCYKKIYQSYFDCFNSWYARTYQERARREKFGDEEDFLKIAGKLNVSMLYLPVSSPSVQVPKSLRECDLTLKICQWHETCWQSGYLSTRIQGTKVWERHYYRLIGSQLIGYTGSENAFQVYNHYNISDVIRLSAAADKIIVTLVEEDANRIFTDSIHQESNEKGFFRLSFKDYYVDCVCDTMNESEEWVKTLKSMIGHVHRFHYILDGIKNIF